MKICYMTGAVINAGDFLIENRSLQILKKVYNEPEICIKKRVGINYDNFIDELNSFDLILFSGGPIYYSGVYSDKQIPFVSDLSCVKSKIAVCGGGGYNFRWCYKRYAETTRGKVVLYSLRKT